MNTTSQLGAPTPTPAHSHRSSSKISTNNRNSQLLADSHTFFPVGCCAVLVVGCREALLVGCCLALFVSCCVALFVGCCTALFVGCFAALHSLVCQLLCGHLSAAVKPRLSAAAQPSQPIILIIHPISSSSILDCSNCLTTFAANTISLFVLIVWTAYAANNPHN